MDRLAPSANRHTIWDGRLTGFGIRVNASGQKSFIIRYRPRGCTEKRYVTVGRYGVLTVDEARVQARRLLGLVANGEDPARERNARRQIPTLSVVVEDFVKMHVATKRKPKTLESYTHALRYHVLPVELIWQPPHQNNFILRRAECPLLRSLSGVKRTCPFALHMSASDPKRTLPT
jgi:hypothetical protein